MLTVKIIALIVSLTFGGCMVKKGLDWYSESKTCKAELKQANNDNAILMHEAVNQCTATLKKLEKSGELDKLKKAYSKGDPEAEEKAKKAFRGIIGK